MIIGGATVYEQTLPFATRVYLTVIHHRFTADVYFPKLNNSVWYCAEKTFRQRDDNNRYDMPFCRYERLTDPQPKMNNAIFAIGYVAGQVAIWHTFFAAQPGQLAGPLAAAASAAAVAALLRRGLATAPWRWPTRPGACCSRWPRAGACRPRCAVTRRAGCTSRWPPSWSCRPGSRRPAGRAARGGFGGGVRAGSMLTRPPGGASPAPASPAPAAALLLTVSVLVWWGYQVLYRRAARADAALAEADREIRRAVRGAVPQRRTP